MRKGGRQLSTNGININYIHIVCIGQDKRVYVWRKRGERIMDLVKRRTDRKTVSWCGDASATTVLEKLTKVEWNIDADKYISILEDNIWPVIARRFP